MINRIRRWLTPPSYPDDELKTLHATLLYVAIFPTLGAAAANIIGNVLGGQTPLVTTFTNVLMAMVCLVSLWATRREHLTVAGAFMLALGWFAITTAAVSLGTIRTPTTTIYLLIVIGGGMLFGWTGLITTVGLSSLTVAGLIVAENAGWLPRPNYAVTVTQWVSYTGLFMMIGLLTVLAVRSTRRALHQAQTELTERKKAEQAARQLLHAVEQSEARYRLLAENVVDVIWKMSLTTGRFVYVSPSVKKLRGYTPEEVLAQPSNAALTPEAWQYISSVLPERIAAFLNGSGPAAYTDEIDQPCKDGSIVPTEAQTTFVLNDQAELEVIGVSRDITARKNAEQEWRKLLRAVEQSPSTIVITSLAGSIEYANPKFTQTTGYTLAEVLGQNPRILKSDHTSSQEYKQMWETIASGGEWHGEFLNKKKNGELYWETATIGPVWNEHGKITHFVAVKEDITDRKRIEEALRESNADLQRRNQELDAYAHTVAHDLKNPLGVIIGYADLLQDSGDFLPPAVVQQSLENISHSGRKAVDIIDALLVLASVRQQEVVAQPLDMGHIVDEAVRRLIDLIRDTAANLHIPDRASWPAALGYAPWVEEIWVNYLSNAIKYGGEQPRIELGAVTQPDGFLRFTVRDFGAGLTPDQQARLFAPFERLNQTRREGHGLGLSVVRRITDKLGGQAGVESQPGEGSTFFFTLPAATAEAA